MKNLTPCCSGISNEKCRAVLADCAALLLRVTFGGTMLFAHGLPKLMAYADKADSFPDPIGLGGPLSLALVIFAEFFCSIAVLLGLLTRLALVPLIFNMAVAVFVIHGADPFNVKELAFVYLVVYAALFLNGPGRFSLDYWIPTLCKCKCKAPLPQPGE